MTWPSFLSLVTEGFLGVRRIAGHDVARPSCRSVRVRPGMLALICSDPCEVIRTLTIPGGWSWNVRRGSFISSSKLRASLPQLPKCGEEQEMA